MRCLALAAAAWAIELQAGKSDAAEGAIKVDVEGGSPPRIRMPEAGIREHGQVDGRIAVGLLSSRKSPYNERLQGVLHTWAPSFTSFKAYTFDEGEAEPHRRTLPLYGPDEAHKRATGLNLAMIPAMLEDFPDAEWLVQADDDTLLLPAHVTEALAKHDKSAPLLMGMCSRWPWHPHDLDGQAWGMDEELTGFDREQWKKDDFEGPFVIGGGGIFMTRAFAEGLRDHVLECRKKYNKMMYGDVRVAACAKDVYGAEALGRFGADGAMLLDGASQERLAPGIVQCLPGATVVDAGVHFNLKAWTVKGPEDAGFAELHPNGEAPLSISLKDPKMMSSVWKELKMQNGPATWERIGAAIDRAEGEQVGSRRHRNRDR